MGQEGKRSTEPKWAGGAFTRRSLIPDLGPTPSAALVPEVPCCCWASYMRISKMGGPLASQKGHSGRCATCAPFQAVDTATPILGPEEVVAMVTQAKGVVQLRTLIHNLGMEGRLVRSWGQQGPSVRPGGNHCFVHSFAHVLSGGPISPISLGAPDGNRFSHSEMPDPVPSRMLMVNLFILLSLGPIHIHSHPSNTSVCTHVHVYMHMHTQSTGQSQNSSIHFLLQETFAGSIKGQAVVGTKE